MARDEIKIQFTRKQIRTIEAVLQAECDNCDTASIVRDCSNIIRRIRKIVYVSYKPKGA